eukprot:g37402.t1
MSSSLDSCCPDERPDAHTPGIRTYNRVSDGVNDPGSAMQVGQKFRECRDMAQWDWRKERRQDGGSWESLCGRARGQSVPVRDAGGCRRPSQCGDVMSTDGASLLLSEMQMYLGPCLEWVSPSGKTSLEALYAAPADDSIMTASVWGGMVIDGPRDLVQFLVARVRTYPMSREILVVPRGWAGVPGCIVSDERDEALGLSRSRLARIQTYLCGEGNLDCA